MCCVNHNPGYFASAIGVGLSVLLLGCTPSPGSAAFESTGPQPIEPSPVQQLESQQELADSNSSQSEVDSNSMQQPASGQGQVLPISAQVEIAGQMIRLEVARTRQQQSMGLMHRPPLPDDRGMLFSFESARPVSFWMKNTPSPLDMIFLRNGEVKAIAANVPPCEADPCPTYGPERAVLIDSVIELRGGRAAELGLEVGDRVEIQFLE